MLLHKYPELEELDFEIMVFVYKQGDTTEAKIVSHFSEMGIIGIEGRLKMLLRAEPAPMPRSKSAFMSMNKPGYLVEKRTKSGIFIVLSQKGEMAVGDYTYRKHTLGHEKRESFIRWLIAVSAAVLAAIFGAVAALGAWREEIARFLFG